MPTRVIHKTLDECLAPRQTMEHGLFLTRWVVPGDGRLAGTGRPAVTVTVTVMVTVSLDNNSHQMPGDRREFLLNV